MHQSKMGITSKIQKFNRIYFFLKPETKNQKLET